MPYDRELVLDQAMTTFWRHGFAATSVRDLRDATGLGARTLYTDFGDKASVFEAALDRYRTRSVLPFYAPLEAADSAIDALHQLIARFEQLTTADRRMGCLVGIGLAEVATVGDDRVTQALDALVAEMHTIVARTIRNGIERREIATSTSADETAALLVAALQGIHLLARLDPDGTPRAHALAGAHRLVDDLRVPEARPHP